MSSVASAPDGGVFLPGYFARSRSHRRGCVQSEGCKEAIVALGVLLVLIGGLFLLDSLDLIEGVGFGELWPVILIAVGVAIIYDRLRRSWRRR